MDSASYSSVAIVIKPPYRSLMEGSIDRLVNQKHKLGNKIFENYDGYGYRKRKGKRLKIFDRLYALYVESEARIETSSNLLTSWPSIIKAG